MMSGSIFKELLREGKLCDTVLRAGDVEFKGHRIILSGCSSYFRGLFCSQRGSEQMVHSFPDVSPNIMQLILDYACTQTLTVTEDLLLEVLAAAHRFGVSGMVQTCCHVLQNSLSSENCISICRLAERYNCRELKKKARLHMLHHFEEVVALAPDFLLLSVEELADIIEQDLLNVRQESFVYDAICRWIERAPEMRRGHVAFLLSKVRLHLMPIDHLSNILSKDDLLRRNMQCMSMIWTTFKTLRESPLERPLQRTRLPYKVLLAIGGFENGIAANKIESYDVRMDAWSTIYKNSIHPSEFCTCVHLRGSIYYIGGLNVNDGFVSSVRKFHLATKVWQEVGPMHVARAFVSSVALNGYIYGFGGINAFEKLNITERFDTDANQWTVMAPMKMRRSDAGAAVLHGKVYVCGGLSVDDLTSSVECYDTDSDQWTLLSSMAVPRAAPAVIAYNNQIYVLGGYFGELYLSNVEVYDPACRQWSTGTPMRYDRCNFGAAVLEEQLYAVGGLHKHGKLYCSKVERFDWKVNRWQLVRDIEVPRSITACCVVERASCTASEPPWEGAGS